tara:strand:+ start:115 stop:1590 length:1476 start_codon:yes stop_codon:yes gene_type:complete
MEKSRARSSPTTELITEKPWSGDLLGREDEASYLIEHLKSRARRAYGTSKRDAYVLNLNAEWGAGKSYFLANLARQLLEQRHLVVKIDAWKDDHASDAFLPLLAAVKELFKDERVKEFSNPEFEKIRDKVLRIGGRLAFGFARIGVPLLLGAGGAVGMAAAEVVRDVASQELGAESLSDFERQQAEIDKFCEALKELAAQIETSADIAAPIFFLVDELDRCRPSFAVQFLERIKHLFAVPKIIFVVATDTDQLIHAISGTYGPDMDSRRYLHRFFDQSYALKTPSMHALVDKICSQTNVQLEKCWVHDESDSDEDKVRFLGATFMAFSLNARDAYRIINQLDTVLIGWRNPTPVNLVYLIPLAICLDQPIRFSKELITLRSMNPSGAASVLREHRATWVLSDRLQNQWADDSQNMVGYSNLLGTLFRFRTLRLSDIRRAANEGLASELAAAYFRIEWHERKRGETAAPQTTSHLDEYAQRLESAGRFSGSL